MKRTALVGICALAFAAGLGVAARSHHASAPAMAEAAQRFLAALDAAKRARCQFAFADEQRFDWGYIPRPRKGLPLADLDAGQRRLAMELLQAGLGQRGYLLATDVMSLELVLRELEHDPVKRDPEKYFFSVFGEPSSTEPWGWRVEGHHLSLNYTVVDGRLVASTPTFFGANPAEVRSGPRAGHRALGVEDDAGRALLKALRPDQRAKAVVEAVVPNDITTAAERDVRPGALTGIAARDLDASQTKLLVGLLELYASTMPDDLADERLAKVRAAGLDDVHFTWIGGGEPGQPHYYQVAGPTFLIELDDTQDNANHIHTVWRDFNGDFGRDLLAEHYKATPHRP